MDGQLKYIVSSGGEFVVFTAGIVHADIARKMQFSAIGAGFIRMSGGIGDTINVECYGQSVSLGLNSRPEDSEFIRAKLNHDYS